MISLFYLVPGSADKMAEEFEEAFKLFTGISQGLERAPICSFGVSWP